MPMLCDPSRKYKSIKPIELPNRQWPSRTLTKAPRWLSTDLRDGNQSLIEPLSVSQKLEYFEMLVEIGYKEIEVAFPCASDTEWNFTRHLVENPELVPDDVWLQVLTPSKPDLIVRTIESIRGAKKAILHFYIASSQQFQDLVLGMSEDESVALVVDCAKLIRSLTKDYDPKANKGTLWALQFGLEAFQDTDPNFAVRICEEVKSIWEPTEENPIIFTLAATIESSLPNVFADQIEYFSTHISDRNKVIVCAHPHNDRGSGVAAAEQAQLAGADRIEGCLFGNGERTGNVDLVTLALNLYTQGVSPNLDFSRLNEIVARVEHFNRMPVHLRAPYAGKLVYCTFAGSHQDGIKKGWRARRQGNDPEERWNMPYLPIDPADLGREEDALIRISSQSGKSGGAWVVEQVLGLDLPRGLQQEFFNLVKKTSDGLGRELLQPEVVRLFKEEYSLWNHEHFSNSLPTNEATNGANPDSKPLDDSKIKGHSPVFHDRAKNSSKESVDDSDHNGEFHESSLEVLKKNLFAETAYASPDVTHLIHIVNRSGFKVVIRDSHTQIMETESDLYHVSYLEGTADEETYKWSIGIHQDKAYSLTQSIVTLVLSLPKAEADLRVR